MLLVTSSQATSGEVYIYVLKLFVGTTGGKKKKKKRLCSGTNVNVSLLASNCSWWKLYMKCFMLGWGKTQESCWKCISFGVELLIFKSHVIVYVLCCL